MIDSRYSKRGVSSQKEDVHKAIKNISKGIFSNAFCKVVDDISGDDNYCSIMHSDGAGTKSSLAYIYWKETGDISVWRGIAQDAIVMNLDDIMCSGAIGKYLMSSTIGRNKNRVPYEVISEIINGGDEFINSLRNHGIDIISAGGETADVGDLVKTVIVDSTFYTRVKKTDIINIDIKPGDVIIGFASYGQSSYEKVYNSGISSNGLTSARHDVLDGIYKNKYPESFDSLIPIELVYSGKMLLGSYMPEVNQTIGQLLLSPTRTYAPLLKDIIEKYRNVISGIIHCTGGGQTKVLKFANKVHIIKDNLLPVPLIFNIIKEQSKTDLKEMYSVFNMGHRLEIYLPEKYAEEIISISKNYNIDAQIIGYCEESEKTRLTIKSGNHIIEY